MPISRTEVRRFQLGGDTYLSTIVIETTLLRFNVRRYSDGILMGHGIEMTRERGNLIERLEEPWRARSNVQAWFITWTSYVLGMRYSSFSEPHKKWLEDHVLVWACPGWDTRSQSERQSLGIDNYRSSRRARAELSDLEDTLSCDNCGETGTDLYVRDCRTGTVSVCENCELHNVQFCDRCETWIDTRNETYDWDYDRCRACRPRNVVRGWDFRPDLIFHPMPPRGVNPMYIGMELEASFRNLERGKEWAAKWAEEDGVKDLIYFKGDSSVNRGFEVVTHPMQPEWAMKKMPFAMFQNGIEEYGMKLTDDSTGTHVHMNKESFTPSTLWKFLQIHIKLPDFCGIVGGRGTSSGFGSFQARSDINGSGERTNFLGVNREQLLEVAKKKGKFDNYERYVAVNLRNEYTLELRYMRGGMAPSEIKKNIQWAWCLYDFANYLDIRDVRDGALENPGYMLWYISEHSDKYPDLQGWIDKLIPRPIALRERTN